MRLRKREYNEVGVSVDISKRELNLVVVRVKSGSISRLGPGFDVSKQ